MRMLTALAIFVSLATGAQAADWPVIHREARAAFDRGDFEKALDLMRQSWTAAGTQAERAISANDIGATFHQLNHQKDAVVWLRQALDLSGMPVPGMCEMLAMAQRTLGQYSEAEQVLRGALTDSRIQGDGRARLLNALGDLLREEGRITDARQTVSEALHIPGASWERQFDAHMNLGDIARYTQDWNESDANLNQALTLARAHNSQLAEASAVRALGETWLDRGDDARAEPLLRRAIAVFSGNPVANGSALATSLQGLGRLYLREDKIAMAEETLQRAIGEDEKIFGEDHPQVAILYELMAQVFSARGQLDTANDYFEHSWRIMVKQFGEKSAQAGSMLAGWGAIEQRAGRLADAAVQYAKALAVLGASPDMESMRLTVMERYAEVLKATHRKREANQVLAEAKAFRAR